jgi:hypothetical protein
MTKVPEEKPIVIVSAAPERMTGDGDADVLCIFVSGGLPGVMRLATVSRPARASAAACPVRNGHDRVEPSRHMNIGEKPKPMVCSGAHEYADNSAGASIHGDTR